MSDTFFKNLDVDAAAAKLDERASASATQVTKSPSDYLEAQSRVTEADAALKRAIQERDILLAAQNEQIRILRLRAADARKLAEALKPRRPVGRPALYKR